MALFYIIFWKVWIILFLMQGTKLFSSQPIRPTKVSFLIGISIEEITLGVTEMFEFENWYESKFVTRLPIFQTIRILMQRHKRTVFGGNGFPLVDTFNRVFDGNLRARRYGEMFNLKGKPHQINGNFLHYRSLRIFSQGKTTEFPMEPPCKSGRKKLSKSLEWRTFCSLERD